MIGRASSTAPASRAHEGSDGWRAGIEAAIRKVRYRQSVLPDIQNEAYKAGLADVLLHLEAMLERGTENSTSVLEACDG